MNILNIEHIHKIFGDKVIFDDISCGIDQGEKIGIIGVKIWLDNRVDFSRPVNQLTAATALIPRCSGRGRALRPRGGR